MSNEPETYYEVVVLNTPHSAVPATHRIGADDIRILDGNILMLYRGEELMFSAKSWITVTRHDAK